MKMFYIKYAVNEDGTVSNEWLIEDNLSRDDIEALHDIGYRVNRCSDDFAHMWIENGLPHTTNH